MTPSGWYVYFIQSGDDGPIKIGKARNPEYRLAHFQTGNPEKLHLLGTIPAAPSLEGKLHGMVEQYRIRGEWFEPSRPVRLLACFASVVRGRYENELEDWQIREELRPLLRRERLLPEHHQEIRSFVKVLEAYKVPANEDNRGSE